MPQILQTHIQTIVSTYIQLHANCILVSGVQRTIICDLQRASIFSVPEGIREIFQEYKDKSIEAIFELYDEELQPRIQEFFDFLLQEDLAFMTAEPACFPKLNLEWRHPSRITNAIFDFNEYSSHSIDTFVKQLTGAGCQGVELRFFCSVDWEKLVSVVKLFDMTKVRDIKIFLAYSEDMLEWDFYHFFVSYQRVSAIVAHSAPSEEKIYESSHFTGVGVYGTPAVINNACHCGAIGTSFFAINIPTFTESQHHNSCLNRKISIDAEGYIKNCPSMAHSFGHISDTPLEDVLANPEFTKLWNIKKDDIQKCKGCEFRHICTDCRAYREDPSDLYSAPLKCGYNPETCEWEAWSTNPLKQQAINHYQLTP